MSFSRPSRLLRNSLLADAVASGTTGLLLALAARPLAPLFGLPVSLIQGAGLALVPYAAAILYLGTRSAMPAGAAWAVVGLNALWVVDSLALLAGPWLAPTGLGITFVLAQALAVGILTEAQVIGLRRLHGTALAL